MIVETRMLVDAAARGERSAVDELLARYLPALEAFVRLRAGALVLGREDTSDVVQSVCREVLEHLEGFRYPGEGAFKHWLFTTAARKLAHRRERLLADRRDVLREVPLDAARSSSGGEALLLAYRSFSSPSGHAVVREELERIERAFALLPEDQREVILLARVVGLSHAEIARQLERSEGAVRVLLHRALARLSGLLEGPMAETSGEG